MMKQILEAWNNLDARQQKLTMIAGGLLVCLLYYTMVWEPIHEGVLQLRQDIRNDQSLLVWMKQAQAQLKRAGKKPVKNANSGNQSILALTEKSLQRAKLSSRIKEIKQVDGGQVRVRFDNVLYTDFLKWLDSFHMQYGAKIERVLMRRTDENGLVNADLRLLAS